VSFSRHLLVDGANILHAWAPGRAIARRDLEAARSQLVQRLAAIHDEERVRVTVVFDGRGPELTIERPSDEVTFSVVRTPAGTTADDVIERLAAQAAEPAACVVATEDRGERETVTAAGAAVIRAADLETWIRRAEAGRARRLGAWQRAGDRAWRRT
jgi:uncharacterized protein